MAGFSILKKTPRQITRYEFGMLLGKRKLCTVIVFRHVYSDYKWCWKLRLHTRNRQLAPILQEGFKHKTWQSAQKSAVAYVRAIYKEGLFNGSLQADDK